MSEILLFSTMSTAVVLGYGFFFGLKHATEADHLAAVSTIVSERRSLLGSAVIAPSGFGTYDFAGRGGHFVLLSRFSISEQTGTKLEFCVGVMLLLLGLTFCENSFKGRNASVSRPQHGARQPSPASARVRR